MSTFEPTDEQREIVELQDGCALVIAAPGSGKTEVLVRRAERLLRSSEGDSARILVLTFSTKAAETIQDRVRALLGDDARRVMARTFHGFATDVLAHYGEVPDRTIYDREEDRQKVLAEAIVDEEAFLGGVDPKMLAALLARIGRWKRDLVSPEDVQLEGTTDGVAYAAYNRRLAQLNAADFDDLLVDVRHLFETSPRVARHYRRMFRHIMIDEAQDTNLVQYEILRSLCGVEHRNVVVFADDHQALYAFAGADRRYLEDFEKDFAPVRRCALVKNFRCASAIVRAANALSAGLTKGAPREMEDDGRAPGAVVFHELASPTEEADFVVGEVQRLLREGLPASLLHAEESKHLEPEQICVLARARYALDPVVAAFGAAGLEIAFSGGPRSAFESRAGETLLLLCRVLRNPRDAIARNRLDLRAESSDFAELAEGDDADIARLAEAVRAVRDPRSNVQALLESVESAFQQWSTEDPNERASIDSDFELAKLRWRRVRAEAGHDMPGLDPLLNDLALVGRTALDHGGTRVLTIHAAKGLEFRAVFLVGMNQGTFPDFRAKTVGQVEDERRSAYVAVTRAQRWLCLTRPRLKNGYPQAPSQFIVEMGLSQGQRGRDEPAL